jgi:hypothetical protein
MDFSKEWLVCAPSPVEHEAEHAPSTHTIGFVRAESHEKDLAAAELEGVALAVEHEHEANPVALGASSNRSTNANAFPVEHEAALARPSTPPVHEHEANPVALGASSNRSTNANAFPVEHEAALAGVLAELAAHPELRPIARPIVAAELVREKRPHAVVRRALAELAAAARIAAAVGDPWSRATIARRARSFVRCAWNDPHEAALARPSTPPVAPVEPVVESPRLASIAVDLRGVLAALDGAAAGGARGALRRPGSVVQP